MNFRKIVPIAMTCIAVIGVLITGCSGKVGERYSFDVNEHICSEHFERSDLGGGYNRLKDGSTVNMLVVGDSIGDGSGATSSDNAWPALVSDYLSSKYGTQVEYTNVSMGGCASLCGYVRVNALDDKKCYDLAVVCYGENDSEENFGLYYEAILRALKAKYPDIDIVCIQESSQRDYTYKMKVIEEIASHYGCPVVDTIAPFSADYDNLVKDGTHPNDEGYKVYAREIESVIDNAVTQGVDTDKEINSYDDNVRIFDNFIWIPKQSVKRRDNSFAINVIGDIRAKSLMDPIGSGTDPVVVIDEYDYEGINRVVVYNNDQMVMEWQLEWPYTFRQRHINVVSQGAEINEGTLKVAFDTKENADSFEGIGFILGY